MDRPKHVVSLTTGAKGIPPGVYTVSIPDGVAPGSTMQIELANAEWLIAAAEAASAASEAAAAGTKSPFDLAKAAENIAPAIATLAMRFVG